MTKEAVSSCREVRTGVTVARMPRKRNDSSAEGAGASPRAQGTDVVRIDADIVQQINIIIAAEGGSTAQLLSPLLRAPIAKKFAEVVKRLAAEQEQKE